MGELDASQSNWGRSKSTCPAVDILKIGIIVALLALLPAGNFPNRQAPDMFDLIALSRIALVGGSIFFFVHMDGSSRRVSIRR